MAFKFLRVKIHTSGIEKIPKGQRMLFVGNHRSNFDPIVEWLVLKQWEIAFISKADNFKVPFFGRFIRKCCFMAIDRENPRKALITINNAIQLLCEDEVSIGVYPEGTRSKSGQLLPFHDSVFRIAKKAERPIVIMSIRGTEDIHKNVMKRRTDVYLDIVKVLSADEIKDKKTHEIGECVKTALEASLSGAVQR